MSGSVETATTHYRLACEANGNVRWRTRAGRLEVAVLREDGRLERHWVGEDGSTTLLERTDVPDTRVFWGVVCVLGLALCAATFVYLVVTHADENTDPTGPLLTWLAGMGLAALGRWQQLSVGYVGAHLGRGRGLHGDWHEPTNLGGWTPSSAALLAAVEQLANAHGGRAIVAHDGSEACVTGFRSFERYALDRSGACRLVERVTGESQARRCFKKLNRDGWHPIITKIEEND